MNPVGRFWVLVLLVAFVASPRWARAASPAEPAASTPAERSKAKAQYDEGAAAYRSGRYARAVELFLAADALAPSAALSFNVARAYEKLGETAKALRYYRDYVRRTAAPTSEVTSAIATLETRLMQRGLQQISVLSEPSADLSIDGLWLGRTPWTGELTPGPHRLVLSREGSASTSRDFDLRAEHAMDLEVRLDKATPGRTEPAVTTASPPGAPGAPERRAPTNDPPRTSGLGPWPFITLAAGGVTLAAAGALELSRRSAEADARRADDQLAYADRLDAMHDRQTAARVLFGVGATLVAVGGTLVVLDLGSDHGKRLVAVACTPTTCVGRVEVSIR